MEEHTEISRKIQRRARSEFDKIIAQHTINKNAKSSEEKITFDQLKDHAQFVKNIKERAEDKFETIIMEERQEAELEAMRKHAESKKKNKKTGRSRIRKNSCRRNSQSYQERNAASH